MEAAAPAAAVADSAALEEIAERVAERAAWIEKWRAQVRSHQWAFSADSAAQPDKQSPQVLRA